jgi:hypothetical protein
MLVRDSISGGAHLTFLQVSAYHGMNTEGRIMNIAVEVSQEGGHSHVAEPE